jgi:hypothetical protein
LRQLPAQRADGVQFVGHGLDQRRTRVRLRIRFSGERCEWNARLRGRERNGVLASVLRGNRANVGLCHPVIGVVWLVDERWRRVGKRGGRERGLDLGFAKLRHDAVPDQRLRQSG